MSKTKFLVIFFLAIAIAFCFSITFAKNEKESDIPEQDGIYDVPGHPEMKVRVFIHKAKPGPAPEPTKVCGLEDFNSTATVSFAGWKLPNTYEYNLNLNNVPSFVGLVNWPTIAENSFNAWNSVLSGKATVTRGDNTTVSRKGLDGQNIVAWGPASGSALGVTYIWYKPSTMEVTELDTILNQKFTWAWSGGASTCAYTNSYDAQNILTHEIGHWFGLDDHYTNDYVNNTMYGYGFKMDAKGDTLTTGDILGVQAIY